MEEFKYEVTQEEVNSLPIGAFEGPVHLVKDRDHASQVLELLSREPLLGFDTESRPSFKKGEHYPISLVQISTESDAYLFILRKTGIPSAMRKLLSDESVIKIGLGLQQEINELRQKGINCAGFVDLEKIAAHHKFKQRGIRALSAFFLKIRISKSAQKSNWAREDLSPAQIKYAATDAWVCLRIYQEMKNQNFLPSAEAAEVKTS